MSYLKHLACGAAALLMAMPVSRAQFSSPAPAPATNPLTTVQAAPAPNPPKPAAALPTSLSATGGANDNSLMLVQASTTPAAPVAPGATTSTAQSTVADATAANPLAESGGAAVREFQGDDVGQVLRLLARQAKINMVVSDQIPPGSTVTMRLEDVTALQAIEIIVKAKGLFLDRIDSVYYIKTSAERTAEPTVPGSYQFSYAQVAAPQALSLSAAGATVANTVAPASATTTMTSGTMTPNPLLLALVKSQLQSGVEPQFDVRTNTVFYRETQSNMEHFQKFLVEIDRPTKQVMIEARLVEVNANPRQSYGINWAGVTGGKTINFGGSTLGTNKLVDAQDVTGHNADGTPILTPRLDSNGIPVQGTNIGTLPAALNPPGDFIGRVAGGALSAVGGQFAILTAPQMSVTLSALNEDSDSEFLANPRVVTADNMPAKIEILRAQPVPSLVPGGASLGGTLQPPTFNGFQDKTFGNTLLVKPSVNKDSFITLSVKPTISSRAYDQTFSFQGAQVSSPVIDSRSLESNVLIKSGDTLAIGGLMQDEVRKGRTKVPVMGDVPILGYLFQSRTNERVKRNLLVFVTPTIIDQRYGTGLEDQVNGLHHSGEEYADPNGWRNNAKGAVRLVPTANRQVAADYPKPGIPPSPARSGSRDKVRFVTEAKDRDF